MTQGLKALYEANAYEASVDGETFALRHGAGCPALDAALVRRGLSCALYVTAWNPNGESAGAAANDQAQGRLRARLRHLFHVFEAPGGWPDGQPDPRGEREPSLLALGVGRIDALALGREFEQAAVVVHAVFGPSEVVMLGPSAP